MLQAVWLGLAGALVYLDTTAVAQFMFSQPLIACPLWGLLVGRPEVGLFFGVTFQLIWLGSLPVGAARFPEGNVGALVATALACRVAPVSGAIPAWITLAVAALIGILTAHFGSLLTPLVRRYLSGYADKVVAAAHANDRARFTALFMGAIGLQALAGFLFTAVAFSIGQHIMSLYLGDLSSAGLSKALIAQTDKYLSGLWPGLMGAGIAVIAARFIRRKNLWWFFAAAALAFGAGCLWL